MGMLIHSRVLSETLLRPEKLQDNLRPKEKTNRVKNIMGGIPRQSEGLEQTQKELDSIRRNVIDGGLDDPIPIPEGLKGRIGRR